MIYNKFDVALLPEIQDITSNCIDNTLDDIKEDYRLLKEESYTLLNYSISSNLSKATTYYNLIFYVEISIKYYLILTSELSIEKIERYGHDIYRLIDVCKQCDNSFEKLRFLLEKIKDKNNKKVNLSKYYNFKYNKEIGELPLIFELKISNYERKIVKEVVEWVNLHI